VTGGPEAVAGELVRTEVRAGAPAPGVHEVALSAARAALAAEQRSKALKTVKNALMMHQCRLELEEALGRLERQGADADRALTSYHEMIGLSNHRVAEPRAWTPEMLARGAALARVLGQHEVVRTAAKAAWVRRALGQPDGVLGAHLKEHSAVIGSAEVLAWVPGERRLWTEVALEVAPGVLRVPVVVAALQGFEDCAPVGDESAAVLETAAMLRADGGATCVEALEVAKALEEG
jgi:hypothetical protein